MTAQPAKNDYRQSPSARIPFRRPAEVIRLPERSSQDRNPPENNREQTTHTVTSNSGSNSGTGITLGDIPGDWASVTTVWTDSPEPLRAMVGKVTQARTGGTPTDIALACWAVLVLIPRGLFHLASWILSHPIRLLAAAVLAAVLLATL